MTANPLLAPAAILVLWSLIVLFWLYRTRFPAFKKSGINVGEARPGARYVDVEARMPPEVNWVSHNYTHLMEQPTLFYAVIAILVLAGDTTLLSVGLAWGYVVLRIAHSIWQIRVNGVRMRVKIFAWSSWCLIGLSVTAVIRTLFL